jgi:tetratricopeptide (TPR) repeat protein
MPGTLSPPASSRNARLAMVLVTIAIAAVAAIAPHLYREGQAKTGTITRAPAVGMSGAPPTSAEGLRSRIGEMESRLRDQPDDTGATTILLADALFRQARSTGDVRATGRASVLLTGLLKNDPGHYEALRMLGAVRLSQHAFREALEIGRRARDLRPHDAWNYGIMGDALIELGRYEEAFQAFDTMVGMRPGAAAYARIAYARELSGDLDGALRAMRMAAGATTPQDVEAQAWYGAQVGELLLLSGQVDEAGQEFRHAATVFPDHPAAVIGQGKVRIAEGDLQGGLHIYLDQLKRTPTLDLAARIGDLYAQQGDADRSEHYYQLAEDLAGPPPAQTEAHLALFLAEHGRKLGEAVRIAEAVAASRDDVFTNDALAWAYFKTGRLKNARTASERALRTGTRDRTILAHAAAIQRAVSTESPGRLSRPAS